jgi:hypothetical protein
MVSKAEKDDPAPVVAVAALAKAVAGIGPDAIAAIKSLKGIGNKDKVEKATNKIQDGMEKAKLMADALRAYSDLNDKVSDFEDDIIDIKFGICEEHQESVSAPTKGHVDKVTQKFAKLQEFPVDDLADKVKTSEVGGRIGNIRDQLTLASKARNNEELQGNLSSILKETKKILAGTFYAS